VAQHHQGQGAAAEHDDVGAADALDPLVGPVDDLEADHVAVVPDLEVEVRDQQGHRTHRGVGGEAVLGVGGGHEAHDRYNS
jgi:hypothetical protein